MARRRHRARCSALAAAPRVGNGISAVRGAVTPGSSGGAAATASAAAPARPAPPVYDTPVNPATQRAFDDASRALRSGRVDEAERAYRALAQANPELGGPHANLGVIYRQAGKVDRSGQPSSSRPSSSARASRST